MFFKTTDKFFFLFFLYISFGRGCTAAQAQIKNGQDLYISDNSVFFVGSGNFNFGTGSIATSRARGSHGILSFSAEATITGVDKTHYIDGYVQTLSHSPFILPIGQSDFYGPVQVSSMSADGVNAAYFRKPPEAVGNELNIAVTAISSVEYWDINSSGAEAEIALSWGSSSAIADLTQFSLGVLSIVGYDGQSWVSIPSTVDEFSIFGELSTLVSGSIRSNTVVDLTKYSAFTVGRIFQQEDFVESSAARVVASANENRLVIQSSLPIKSFAVYDLMGKKILAQRPKGEYRIDLPFDHAKAIYIVKIELENSLLIFTQKIIN